MTVTGKDGQAVDVPVLDVLYTRRREDGALAIAIVNKHPDETRSLSFLPFGDAPCAYRLVSVRGEDVDSFNEVGRTEVTLTEGDWTDWGDRLSVTVQPHSVNVVQIVEKQ